MGVWHLLRKKVAVDSATAPQSQSEIQILKTLREMFQKNSSNSAYKCETGGRDTMVKSRREELAFNGYLAQTESKTFRNTGLSCSSLHK